jgi:hypothetical protein
MWAHFPGSFEKPTVGYVFVIFKDAYQKFIRDFNHKKI